MKAWFRLLPFLWSPPWPPHGSFLSSLVVGRRALYLVEVCQGLGPFLGASLQILFIAECVELSIMKEWLSLRLSPGLGTWPLHRSFPSIYVYCRMWRFVPNLSFRKACSRFRPSLGRGPWSSNLDCWSSTAHCEICGIADDKGMLGPWPAHGSILSSQVHFRMSSSNPDKSML